MSEQEKPISVELGELFQEQEEDRSKASVDDMITKIEKAKKSQDHSPEIKQFQERMIRHHLGTLRKRLIHSEGTQRTVMGRDVLTLNPEDPDDYEAIETDVEHARMSNAIYTGVGAVNSGLDARIRIQALMEVVLQLMPQFENVGVTIDQSYFDRFIEFRPKVD